VIRLTYRRRPIPARRQIVRRFLTTVTSVGVVACISGCEPGKDFSITNATGQTLTVSSRFQREGEAPSPSADSLDVTLTLAPGEKTGVRLYLDKGSCTNRTFLAYDQAGHLLYTDPAPICRDGKGRGNSWTIIAK